MVTKLIDLSCKFLRWSNTTCRPLTDQASVQSAVKMSSPYWLGTTTCVPMMPTGLRWNDLSKHRIVQWGITPEVETPLPWKGKLKKCRPTYIFFLFRLIQLSSRSLRLYFDSVVPNHIPAHYKVLHCFTARTKFKPRHWFVPKNHNIFDYVWL